MKRVCKEGAEGVARRRWAFGDKGNGPRRSPQGAKAPRGQRPTTAALGSGTLRLPPKGCGLPTPKVPEVRLPARVAFCRVQPLPP